MQLHETKPRVPPGPPPRAGGVVSALRYAASFYFDPFAFVGARFERYGDIYYAPSGGALGAVFEDIAEKIFTRLTR